MKKRLRSSLVYSGVAVAATGLAVSSGIAMTDDAPRDNASASLAGASASLAGASDLVGKTADAPEDRVQSLSRSDRRTTVDTAKKRALNQESGGQATRTEDLSTQDPRDIARAMMPQFGFSEAEFSCLDALYTSESGWRVDADNPTSSAYGIPQALPGDRMAAAGSDWATNPATQIKWGLGYIRDSYGTPCSAWSFKQGAGWY